MDLGLFRRRGTWIWIWTFGSIVVTALIYHASHVYMLYSERSLARRAAMLWRIPNLKQAVSDVQATVDSFTPRAGSREDDIARLSVRLNRVADAIGFRLDSFDVMTTAPGAAIPVKIKIRGRGNFREILAFIEEIRRPESLLTVESAHVALTGLKSDPDYNGEFVLTYHFVRS